MILGLGLSKYIAEQHIKTANEYPFDDYQRPHSYSSNFAALSSMLSLTSSEIAKTLWAAYLLNVEIIIVLLFCRLSD
jgi:hypothetical protein